MDEYISNAISNQLPTLATISLLFGLGKGGVPGLSTIAPAATVLTAPTTLPHGLRYAVALQVPILTIIDIYTAFLYQRQLDWCTIWLLLPFTFVGMVMEQLFLDERVTDRCARLVVGFMLLSILVVRSWRGLVRFLFPSFVVEYELIEHDFVEGEVLAEEENEDKEEKKEEEGDGFLDNERIKHNDVEGGGKIIQKSNDNLIPITQQKQTAQSCTIASVAWACTVGIIGGIATMLTNSMGPIVNVYLLSIAELSPEAYVGTRAMFFCFINMGKLGMRIAGGTIGWKMLPLVGGLGLVSVVGVCFAKPIMNSMSEKMYVRLELGVVAFAGLRLCYKGLFA